MKSTTLACVGLGFIIAAAYADNTVTPSLTNEQHKMQTEKTLLLQNKTKQLAMPSLKPIKKKPGVVILPDGLQYKIIVEGKGSKPKDSDTVTVNYAGTLINGKEFDSSYKRGQPASFPVIWSFQVGLKP